MSYVNQYPMIFKNLYNSMRIAPILEAIPEACFIVCKRDIYQQAFSILDGRVKNLHTKERWWSLPPKEIEQLIGRHYAEQIVGQIFCTYRQIEQDIRDWGENRFFEVCYEEFCEDVYGTLTSIERFLARHGCILKKRWQVPDRFDVQRREMNPEDLRFIQQARDRWGDA